MKTIVVECDICHGKSKSELGFVQLNLRNGEDENGATKIEAFDVCTECIRYVFPSIIEYPIDITDLRERQIQLKRNED